MGPGSPEATSGMLLTLAPGWRHAFCLCPQNTSSDRSPCKS